jgi:DNA-binding transcriptional regulator GbsR (MarR family)
MEEPAEDVLRFIADRIDTVPEIEALLLLWEQRPVALTAQELASKLFISASNSTAVISALEQRKLVRRTGNRYAYDSAWEPHSAFMAQVASTYRDHLIRIATLIHSKAPRAVREFARAFAPKKEI